MTTDSPPEESTPAATDTGHSFWSLLILLAAAAAILIVLQARRPKANRGSEYVGLPLPPLDAGGWLNTKAPLTADALRGKVVLLDFWASDCLPCVAHLPELIQINKKFRDRGLVVVGLSLESGLRLQRLKALVETREGLDWPVGYNAQLAYEMLNIYGTPTYLLYDRQGRSVWGGHSLEGCEDAVVSALAE